jgi:hypothetical protein
MIWGQAQFKLTINIIKLVTLTSGPLYLLLDGMLLNEISSVDNLRRASEAHFCQCRPIEIGI